LPGQEDAINPARLASPNGNKDVAVRRGRIRVYLLLDSLNPLQAFYPGVRESGSLKKFQGRVSLARIP
jgi:hypothetical protein